MITANEALKKLQDGNQRFASGVRSIDTLVKQMQRSDLVERQSPFAIILGCSDARVPAEIIFDQGLGDLFVIRVAGNIVAPSQLGSIEFAVKQFGSPLVVVLGHSNCGAVIATLNDLKNPSEKQSSSVLSIVNRIRSTVEPLFDKKLLENPQQLLETAIRANILASTNQLKHESKMLEQLTQKSSLTIVGAEYSLETGKVDFISDI